MASRRPTNGGLRWALPIVFLTSLSLAVFWTFYTVDHYVTGGPPHPNPDTPLHRYVQFDPESITDAVSALAAMIAAIFGIVITVVSIVVQLSAGRYSGVARMFRRDTVNLAVMAFYVIFCVTGIWLSVALHREFVPRAAILAMMSATTLGIVMIAPYFSYVFWFLEPMNIVHRLRYHAERVGAQGIAQLRTDRVDRAQASIVSAMEELRDIASNAISGKDKIIASGAVDALKDFCLHYASEKHKAVDAWFSIGADIRENPDFVVMDPESLADLEARRTWVEWKIMRQYLGVYNEALHSMRDICYLVAIDTRYIGEDASQKGDPALIDLNYRFMNSYLRATLNARDVRTAYNVLNQYRLLVETHVSKGNHEAVLSGARHLVYYGHVSFDMNLNFVTETVAYDLSALCSLAHERAFAGEDAILAMFLELDRPLRVKSQEAALVGVRKAQVKLAAYYLVHGEEEKAKLICEDMREEPVDRLARIRASLEGVTTKDFWEIIDRGRNFEYMPDEQRQCLARFFAWLNIEG